jgi:hypothetical protein
MHFHLHDGKTREKFYVLATLWAVFSGAFLTVIAANF